ncbi:aldo/keto reductase [Lactobacillus xylocopicola]|uniref:Oxidoreductase n=1 Tax=Lactobacillus xylocopicola TaxID=2976676 RepID=A0ABM8BGT1_9LACO|nr:aldo/keto reductase [Lactobacillus xylocopicola]BDR60310.1 oxidoreductase [Lactobacillus xylocopicola]
MEYAKIGKTNLKVSKLCLGGMSFGQAGTMHDWTLDKDQTEEMVRHALDLGINFFDTANSYSAGTGEEYLGQALKNNVPREQVVIASKVYFNPGRLSREAIKREIDGTLTRLGTDYLDLYIIHRFDYETPIEETMSTLNDLVKAGKVRALGASAMYGYQFYNMQLVARDHGWTTFSAMENHYNLLYREDERELIPICKQMDVALMPYSSLAAGRLARPTWSAGTVRSKTDRVAKGKYDHTQETDRAIAERVHELAQKHDATMVQIALAWMWAKGVTAPIIGATKIKYLDDAAGAFKVKLTNDERKYLEELYVPHNIVGAVDQNPPEGTILLDQDKENKNQ